MALLAYLFYIFISFGAGILIHYFFNGHTKKNTRIGKSPSTRYNFVRRILPLGRSNWELVGLENSMKIWAKSGDRSVFASSVCVSASLKSVKKILTDPSSVVEWNPGFKTVSRISALSSPESSSELHFGDVISVTETSNTSFSRLQYFYGLLNCFRSEKVYERVWNFEDGVKFWLHLAVVEPSLTDPIFTLLMVFPIKGKRELCQVIIASELQTNFNAGTLTASLTGLRNLILNRHYEVVLPEIKEDEKDCSGVAEKGDLDDDDVEQDEEKDGNMDSGQQPGVPSEEFVDVAGVYYSPDKDTQKYKVVIDSALKRLMQCYHAKDKQNGWCSVANIRDVEIVKRPASPDFSIWDCSKGTTDINVPIHYLLAYLEDIDKTSEHDDMFITGQVIEEFGELTKILHVEYKAIWPVSDRDFCTVSAIRVLQDGTVTRFFKHVKHSSCPPCKKYVRGKILIAGYIMKIISTDPPRIRTTYVTHVDLQGSVPSRIVNKITASQPASVGLVKKYVERMYQDELANPDRPASKFKTEAMAFYERLQRVQEVMAKTPSSQEVSEKPDETPQPAPAVQKVNGDVRRASDNEGQPPSNDPEISPSILEYGGMDYKTIGNQACAGLMQEAFEVSEVEISKPAGPSVPEQWQYRETDKKVLIFKKVHQNEKMHSFVGKGIISCPPPKVWEVLKEIENHYRFDNMLKEIRTLEILSDTQRIEYLHFETAKCFNKEARDFIVLRTGRKEKDKYLMSIVSVDYPNSPSKKDVKRGKIIASGWVVEPLLHNGQLYSMVTYLTQLNPGGSIPTMLVNLVARKQPLCVAYLRRMIENPNQSLNRSLSQSLAEPDQS